MAPLRFSFGSETIFAGEVPGQREGDQVLVAVQLPNHFVVADLVEVEERNLIPGFARGALVVDRIEVPVDGIAKVEVFVAEQIEAMAADPLGLVQQAGRAGGGQIEESRGGSSGGIGPEARRPAEAF